jgi:hypothetical protein
MIMYFKKIRLVTNTEGTKRVGMIGYGLNNKSRKISCFEKVKNPLFIHKIIVYKIVKIIHFFQLLA